MIFWLWAAVGAMAVVIVLMLVKIRILQRSAREIETAFADRLTTETNTLIDISSNDRYMRGLANAVNMQLRTLRAQRRRFERGDTELKNAITNISHDLRTPLTAICGYLELLEAQEKTESVTRYLNIIRNRTESLMQLTEEFFQYSIIVASESEMTIEPVAVDSLLEESIAAFYSSLTGRGITPDIKITGRKIIRNADRSALTRVFANLLNNAVKYSDGDLFIELTDEGEIVFTNTASELSGIQVGKLFDRFYTVEAARNSTGLGLAIAKTLIEQMGGTISAGYRDGKLSIVISLPEQAAAVRGA